MLTLLDNRGPYQLPTGWHQVTTAQYCALDAQQLFTTEARASYFAGRPVEATQYVADCLAFMAEPPSAEPGYLRFPADLGQETYLQVEEIRKLLGSQPLHQCYAQVYGIFGARLHNFRNYEVYDQRWAEKIADACLGLPISQTYPAVAHCFNELARLGTKYAALSEPDHTEAGRRARAAGADRLSVFSHLNVSRHYAEVFGLSINEVYQKPWEEIALYLLQDRMQAEVADNLQKNSQSNSNGKDS